MKKETAIKQICFKLKNLDNNNYYGVTAIDKNASSNIVEKELTDKYDIYEFLNDRCFFKNIDEEKRIDVCESIEKIMIEYTGSLINLLYNNLNPVL